MTDQPRINPDIAAKARASVLEEGEAGFDMSTWYHSNCNTTACLAGHIGLVAGKIPKRASAFAIKAKKELFGVDRLHELPGNARRRLEVTFLMTGADREEVIEEFDSLVRDYLPEDVSFDTYLHKSYGYQSYYRQLQRKIEEK